MSSPILVTGGTGTLGRHVVRRLLDAGHAVRIASRHAPQPQDLPDGATHVVADLGTGEGLERAVADAATVVHLAGGPKGDGEKTRALVAAIQQRPAKEGPAPHLVSISVVGAERVPVVSGIDRMAFAYYASKRDQELAVEHSGLPWTTLRATQFHDLLLTAAQAMAKLPVIPVPGIRFQPIETDEVAARLVELALAEPAGLVAEIGGPEVLTMKQAVRRYLEVTGRHRLTMPVRVPGGASRALREGANLTPDHAVGKRTWEEFLAERVGRS